MSKKQVAMAFQYANALANDVAGNVLSGNDIRAAAYLTALHEILKEGATILDAGSDMRAERRFTERLQEVNETLEANLSRTPFDQERMETNFARFEEAGYTLPGVKGVSGLSSAELEEMIKQHS